MGDVNNKSRNKEKETHLEVLCDLTNKTLEGELPDKELRRLLVATNLAEGDGTGPEAMRLLDTTSSCRSGSLARRRLGSELLTRCLT